jgi:CO/xanthine dehydrogenase Mo-binding subunit
MPRWCKHGDERAYPSSRGGCRRASAWRARRHHAPQCASAGARTRNPIGPQPLPPFQSDVVLHYGQHVAMVVAETMEQANAAAALIEVTVGTSPLSYRQAFSRVDRSA